jgi:hypothetical protein
MPKMRGAGSSFFPVRAKLPRNSGFTRDMAVGGSCPLLSFHHSALGRRRPLHPPSFGPEAPGSDPPFPGTSGVENYRLNDQSQSRFYFE